MKRVRQALLLGFILTASCSRWRAESVQPHPEVGDEPGTVRVTRHDGSQVVLRDARVTNDTIHGQHQIESDDWAEHAIALRDVRLLEVRRTDGLAQAALILIILTTAGVAAFGVALYEQHN